MLIFSSNLLKMLPIQQYPKTCHTGLILPDSSLMFNLEILSSNLAFPKRFTPILLSLFCLFDPLQSIFCVSLKNFCGSCFLGILKKILTPGNIFLLPTYNLQFFFYNLHPFTFCKLFPVLTPSLNLNPAF